MTSPDGRPLTVVGIGDDGWEGLAPASMTALRAADVVLGGMPVKITRISITSGSSG